MVPDLVYNMMAWILSSQSEYYVERISEISPDVHRLTVSLSEDLIHCENPKACCPAYGSKRSDRQC